MLTDIQPVKKRVNYAIGYAAISVTALFLIVMYLAQRRRNLIERFAHQRQIEETLLNAQRELEVQVKQRTLELIETNKQLDHKVKQQESTERDLRNIQEELVQSAKLAVLGQMSAGITHELNQPLTAIQTYVGTAQQLLQHQRYDELNENLSNVMALTSRMARFTGQLKSFTRKSTQNISEVSLKQTLNDALTLITDTHNLEIEIIKSFPEEEISVLADALRLEQVFVNIFKNAMDAMQNTQHRKLYLSMHASSDSVSVEIKDSGPGIAEAFLPKLFDPFITSKEAGAGLGLGMSISQEIISGFGGSIKAGNEQNGGAVFTIKLPMAKIAPSYARSVSLNAKLGS